MISPILMVVSFGCSAFIDFHTFMIISIDVDVFLCISFAKRCASFLTRSSSSFRQSPGAASGRSGSRVVIVGFHVCRLSSFLSISINALSMLLGESSIHILLKFLFISARPSVVWCHLVTI